ncbi:uncharacterized protein LOC117171857 [Belonocnema kinseyi]|uniref:uncharacterized protein LOC117171857 n=1 Tax=Belonocnema kinseyi TaxID=2817044 RepID=UPI00143D014B|nr:uncharacterized protein LOC117171857 [Belonocnema kinseyi]
MGWVLTGLGAGVAIVLVAGVALVLCKSSWRFYVSRYFVGWQCGPRNVWSICEEWLQRLSWLWAPREEKVGLVKAQHPTAQAVPGLYRHTGNTSHHLLHSDSDLRLDAQGSFTRFEAVDKDLHPPLGTGCTIPPQPLRPAPQPRQTARPRPSPLYASNNVDYFRMQDNNCGPLTPPPFLFKAPSSSRVSEPSIFLFQNEDVNAYTDHLTLSFDSYASFRTSEQSKIGFENYTCRNLPETIQMSSSEVQHQTEMRSSNFDRRYDMEIENGRRKELSATRNSSYKEYDHVDEPAKIRYSVQGAPISKHELKFEYNDHDNFCQASQPYGSYDIVQRNSAARQHTMHESTEISRSFGLRNCNNITTQTSIDSICRPQTVSKILQNAQVLSNHLTQKVNEIQNIEMVPFRTPVQEDSLGNYSLHSSPTKLQGLQRVSEYIQNLPDRSMYDTSHNHLSYHEHEGFFRDIHFMTSPNGVVEKTTSFVPPPALPNPPNSGTMLRKNGPTTGERIFNALRSVTSQSYIDASEFYNSVRSTAQQVQNFKFSSLDRIPSVNDGTLRYPDHMQKPYMDRESEASITNSVGLGLDLYNPELNLEANRTAQEVYKSLQDTSTSTLLPQDLSQEPYSYLQDPSFTRTSEDIFNSLEQRRKSMERLNDIQEHIEMESNDISRRKSSQDLYAALEEVQMKRRLSQGMDESYMGYSMGDFIDRSLGVLRGSLPEPEPPPDSSTLQRAVSFESVSSDTSVNLADLDEAPIVGHVCVGLEYEKWGGRKEGEGGLSVSVLEARDLITADGQPAQDTFSRVYILPNTHTVAQTRLCRCSPSPSYQEKFLFPLEGGPVGRTLLVKVFSIEMGLEAEASLLGEATLRLRPAPRPPATTWLPLVSPALPVPRLGELMFSISYLPTAERLTLVVVKARNIRGTQSMDTKKPGDIIPGNFFVKVYLLQQGKKVHKKRTSIKKGEKSPIFNEAIIFSVPAHALQTIQLRLTVAEVTGDQILNAKYSVGHVIVGSSTSGRALAHWRQMLAALRKPVAMWHPLRK